MNPGDDPEGDHITMSTEDRLVLMANQIGRFFASQKDEDPAEGVTAHLARFWDPRMRETIGAYLARGGQGLDPIARDAVAALKR
jgi:formate dehydrogenase subunit delta